MRTKEQSREVYQQWLEKADGWVLDDLRAMSDLQDESFEKELMERFSMDADFGTGGLRNLVRAGTNGINDAWIERIATALAQMADSVVIAYDTRHHSASFARLTACVLTRLGKTAWVFPDPAPTPVLSFAVRHLRCDAGVVITASHNPSGYNGFKVYDYRGVQMVPARMEELKKHLSTIPFFCNSEGACDCEKTNYQTVPESVLQAYEERVMEQVRPWIKGQEDSMAVVYTPLNGTGASWIPKLLNQIGMTVLTVDEQMREDPDFSTLKLPNPEDPASFERALALAGMSYPQPQAIIATDPDTDRMGVSIWNGISYQFLNGNEIGVLLLDFLLQKAMVSGKDLKKMVVLKTIVSTEMVNRMQTRYGFRLVETLTGFKYLGDRIERLDSNEEEFLFGFEESYGYLFGDQSRDKDAIMGSLLFCLMLQHHGQAQRLLQNLEVLRGEYGFYGEGLINQEFPGVEGLIRMNQFIQQIREKPPVVWADQTLTSTRDYLQESGDMMGDVLEWRFGKKLKIIIRPSGTEPKLKVYFSCRENTQAETDSLLEISMHLWHQLLKR